MEAYWVTAVSVAVTPLPTPLLLEDRASDREERAAVVTEVRRRVVRGVPTKFSVVPPGRMRSRVTTMPLVEIIGEAEMEGVVAARVGVGVVEGVRERQAESVERGVGVMEGVDVGEGEGVCVGVVEGVAVAVGSVEGVGKGVGGGVWLSRGEAEEPPRRHSPWGGWGGRSGCLWSKL